MMMIYVPSPGSNSYRAIRFIEQACGPVASEDLARELGIPQRQLMAFLRGPMRNGYITKSLSVHPTTHRRCSQWTLGHVRLAPDESAPPPRLMPHKRVPTSAFDLARTL